MFVINRPRGKSRKYVSFKGEVFVIRDIRLLQRLAEAVNRRENVELKELLSGHVAAEGLASGGLVAVSLRCAEGRPEPLARLHLPDETDLETTTLLQEPVHADSKKCERKAARKSNLKLLRQWRRDRLRKKKGSEPIWKDEEVEELRRKSQEFRRSSWLLESPQKAMRTVVGYVTQADFKHSEGCGVSQGFITLTALVQAVKIAAKHKKPAMLLLRNVRHSRYHRAQFRVIID